MSLTKSAFGVLASGVLGLTLAFSGAVAHDSDNTQVNKEGRQAPGALQCSSVRPEREQMRCGQLERYLAMIDKNRQGAPEGGEYLAGGYGLDPEAVKHLRSPVRVTTVKNPVFDNRECYLMSMRCSF